MNRKDIARDLLTARRELRQGNLFWAGWWAGLATQRAHDGMSKTGSQVNYIVGRMMGM